MTKTHIYTTLLMGSRFFIHRRTFVKLHGRCKYSAQQKNLPTKNHGQDSSYKKSPRLSVRGKFYLI